MRQIRNLKIKSTTRKLGLRIVKISQFFVNNAISEYSERNPCDDFYFNGITGKLTSTESWGLVPAAKQHVQHHAAPVRTIRRPKSLCRYVVERLLEGSDWLLAQDIGRRAFNSGVIAFRRTERNDAMPRDMMTTIAARQDRSNVYASDGNPLHSCAQWSATGSCTAKSWPISSASTRPRCFAVRTATSSMTNGCGPPRARTMAHDGEPPH